MTVIIIACSWLPSLEKMANESVDAGLKRALISFGTARAINAVISVIEGTELAFQPAGVGIKTSVGQVLRPVNGVVEQLSHLMLAASVAFGIERILLSVSSDWMASLLLTVIAISWSFFYLRRRFPPHWLTRTLAVLVMIRFAMPVSIIGSEMLFQHFMATDYRSSQTAMEIATGNLRALQSTTVSSDEDQSAWDKLKGWTSRHADIKSALTNLAHSAEDATERIIKLMVIFVLQTLLLPIFMLWALWGLIRGAFSLPFAHHTFHHVGHS